MQTINHQYLTTKNYFSNGKLLLTAEYLVLDGAKALALPAKYGQDLVVKVTDSDNVIIWKSYNVNEECWFKAEFNLQDLTVVSYEATYGNPQKVAETLREILQTAKTLNSDFLSNESGLEVSTYLTFPNEWGLGTSSTLINSIASWANINAFELLEKSFGGSGYDIACAQNNTPITYKRNGVSPEVGKVTFNPSFKDQLFFVYLNQKQDSKEGIKMYRGLTVDKTKAIAQVNKITQSIITSNSLVEFESLIEQHEDLLANLLGIEKVKDKLFSDYKGQVKSLGAWGGDFVLVTGEEKEVKSYFLDKGYKTIIPYEKMIK